MRLVEHNRMRERRLHAAPERVLVKAVEHEGREGVLQHTVCRAVQARSTGSGCSHRTRQDRTPDPGRRVSRPPLEVADIFHRHGAAWRAAHAGHLSLDQLKVMAAIETCRTAALGGHVEACEDCGHTRIAYNSCRTRHCPKCQGAAAREWLAAREADLLPVGYFHVVFTLPAEIADIAGTTRR